MTVTVHIYPDKQLSLEVPDGTDETFADNKSRLSLQEFDALADKLADLSMEIDGPDAQPLSDYAMSRESIYENHPKL